MVTLGLIVGGLVIGLLIGVTFGRVVDDSTLADFAALSRQYGKLKLDHAALKLHSKMIERTAAVQRRMLETQAQDFANALYAENVEKALRLQRMFDELYPSGGPTRSVHVTGPPLVVLDEQDRHYADLTAVEDERRIAVDGWSGQSSSATREPDDEALDGIKHGYASSPEYPRPDRIGLRSWDDVSARVIAKLEALGWKRKG